MRIREILTEIGGYLERKVGIPVFVLPADPAEVDATEPPYVGIRFVDARVPATISMGNVSGKYVLEEVELRIEVSIYSGPLPEKVMGEIDEISMKILTAMALNSSFEGVSYVGNDEFSDVLVAEESDEALEKIGLIRTIPMNFIGTIEVELEEDKTEIIEMEGRI